MNEPGRHVIVSFEGWKKAPSMIRDHDLQQWKVLEVVDYWEHADYADHGRVEGKPGAEAQRYQLRVDGPLPDRVHESGEQAVTLHAYGTGSGWYMKPA